MLGLAPQRNYSKTPAYAGDDRGKKILEGIKLKKNYKRLFFPNNFFWGAATSAHQVEGYGVNNWSEWEKSKKRLDELKRSGELAIYGQANYISGKACNHYDLYEEDFQLAKDLGHNCTRLSISWARIQPDKDRFDKSAIEHYKKVLLFLRKLDLEPFVTIWHWDLPLWLTEEGGWLSSKTPEYFRSYVKILCDELGDLVNYWITINEPLVYASNSYQKGSWPPQHKSFAKVYKVLKHMIKGHILAYKDIKQNNEKAFVGIAKNNVYFGGGLFKKPLRYFWNYYFLNKLEQRYDFIGLNFYFENNIHSLLEKLLRKSHRKKKLKYSDMGWLLKPRSIKYTIAELKKYGVPIFITENGLADAEDKYRKDFISQALYGVYEAIQQGADVRGYMHWSLMDNFEWAEGFWPRFGLIGIDYKTQKRKIRPSAHYYKKICTSNSLDEKEIIKSNIF
ncbi:glycoside hydrolase family 1 protein [Candidatus Nomurabacteria bacterium]|uniref:Glycoside hydrolase family 1 protein n=1 Tax=candidate division WWE3 bacterium TaxID=2053526 RepID=A0A955E1M7_UNCKA|nr:glycoside hydrolase family 1 protein [candidate division WWE3 bacterium]MCB9823863.1 glycoside hydrolase family 1 protein [Candidatus Nomurabacteria bacterium]MCB9827157.1 glycoside hydrolase family 1 protein [Candidatus Nomurabacteria bacterium]MCB9827802.1 glycoside hydrolase family 1 protein [Candidatus Nomurabacteria bacterium]HXK52615.1 glycoside hydrolase family 1 protein [bacterium]